jgi:ribonuclease Z
MHLFGRTKELEIFGPPGLSEIITIQLRCSETILNYRVIFHELETEENRVILTHPKVTVETIPLIHRIRCCGFIFRETPKTRKIRKEMLPEDISLLAVAALKKGEDVYDEHGHILYSCEELTLPPRKSVSYAFMSDTAYSERFLDLVKGIDVLYHEATFLNDMRERAIETYHTTANDAAVFAQKAEAGRLIIGHFSSRYRELQPLLDEARAVFENTWLALEGETFNIYQ